MEDKNYSDDFELFLKESIDDFRMVPSRKVWYSIYNNMHPARRWPSMAVCLLILTAVLYLGIENNNSLSNAARRNASENFTTNLNQKKSDKNITFLLPITDNSSTPIQQNQLQTSTQLTSEETEVFPTLPQNTLAGVITNSENNTINIITNANNELLNELEKNKLTQSSNNKLKIGIRNNLGVEKEGTKIETSLFQQKEITEVMLQNDVTVNKETIAAIKNDKDKALKDLIVANEKSWREDYAFRNKPAINKLKQNGSISYYITPSLGYRKFGKRDFVKRSTGNTNSFSSSSLIGDRKLDDEAALNLELGAAFQYSVSKNIRIKTGLQANYTNYTSNVTSLGHPSQVALDVSNSTPLYAASNYSSASGSTMLNKTSIQIALPIGADVKLADIGNLKWHLGATLQPTYVVKGSGYALSSDGSHYASEPSLLRKLNLNSAIESFISFKASPGVTMMVGPQLRYQLFSTYKNEYNYSEKLYNIGLKLGISTTF